MSNENMSIEEKEAWARIEKMKNAEIPNAERGRLLDEQKALKRAKEKELATLQETVKKNEVKIPEIEKFLQKQESEMTEVEKEYLKISLLNASPELAEQILSVERANEKASIFFSRLGFNIKTMRPLKPKQWEIAPVVNANWNIYRGYIEIQRFFEIVPLQKEKLELEIEKLKLEIKWYKKEVK